MVKVESALTEGDVDLRYVNGVSYSEVDSG